MTRLVAAMANILVVDDEPDILAILSILLPLEGHSVQTTTDPERALDIATTTAIDLVITDWMMPRMDGLELCRRLRAEPRTRNIPIIMSSAAGDRPEGRGRLYDAYIPKPSDFNDQVKVIERLLRSDNSP
jgi:CheY-like chemotaxis protein